MRPGVRLKRAAGVHERLFTVICAVGSFFMFMLAFKYIARYSHTSYTTGLGVLFIVFLETAIAPKEDLEISPLRIFFIFTLSL